MKTNKSYSKRLRKTRTGKVVARTPGQNHFNAKESGSGRQRRNRTTNLTFKRSDAARFLPRN